MRKLTLEELTELFDYKVSEIDIRNPDGLRLFELLSLDDTLLEHYKKVDVISDTLKNGNIIYKDDVFNPLRKNNYEFNFRLRVLIYQAEIYELELKMEELNLLEEEEEKELRLIKIPQTKLSYDQLKKIKESISSAIQYTSLPRISKVREIVSIDKELHNYYSKYIIALDNRNEEDYSKYFNMFQERVEELFQWFENALNKKFNSEITPTFEKKISLDINESQQQTKKEILTKLLESSIPTCFSDPIFTDVIKSDNKLSNLLSSYQSDFHPDANNDPFLLHIYYLITVRIKFLINNERYNENFNLYIQDEIKNTEESVNAYEPKKFHQHRLTPLRLVLKLKDSKVLDNLESLKKWLSILIIRNLRNNLSKETQLHELIKIYGNEIFQEKISSLFDSLYEHYIKKLDSSMVDSNGAKLSLVVENSSYIDFEKIFGRTASTCRSLYQGLCEMAEQQGKFLILFQSFRSVALKCKTKIDHKPIRSLLEKLHNKGLIYVTFKNKKENDLILEYLENLKNIKKIDASNIKDIIYFLKNKEAISYGREILDNLKKENKINTAEYNYILNSKIKHEFLDSILINNNGIIEELPKLKTKIVNPFFKSELHRVKALGKRGNEIFWLVFNNKKMTKKEIYNSFPNIRNKTNSLGDKIDTLVSLGLFNVDERSYTVNTYDFILKIELGKELDQKLAIQRYNKKSQEVLKKNIKRFNLTEKEISEYTNVNIINLIKSNQRYTEYLLSSLKDGFNPYSSDIKIFEHIPEYFFNECVNLNIITFNADNNQYHVNSKLIIFIREAFSKVTKTIIPHQNEEGHFLTEQSNKYIESRKAFQQQKDKDETVTEDDKLKICIEDELKKEKYKNLDRMVAYRLASNYVIDIVYPEGDGVANFDLIQSPTLVSNM